jgi:flavin-dependent dehydrogenase
MMELLLMEKNTYDIIILGGGIAGSLMAISIRRKNPSLQILIIERSTIFPNKVGESSAEMTGLFFNRFKIDHILKKQVQKAGLRFLFNEKNSANFSVMDEFSSPAVKSISNGYHFNRQQFDEDLLGEAEKLGTKVLRPAEIVEFKYEKFNSEIIVRHENALTNFRATWMIDASGTERIAGKKLGWAKKDLSFDTAASFAHFEGLKPSSEWDTNKNPYWEKYAIGPKSQSTIHFLRPGCWWWHIELNNNTTSIGVVYDKTIIGKIDPEKFFDDFLENDAQLKFITEGTKRGPIKHLPKLPYLSNRLYDDGIAVIGDAAAFIDPLFSPGIEFSCQQSIWLSDLIVDYFVNEKMNEKKWKKYEKVFLQAFSNRILVYEKRYQLMGSYDLFSNWVQLDFFAYFGFTIIPAVWFPARMKFPPRFVFPTKHIYNFFTRRYLKIARRRARQNRTSTSLKKPISLSHVGLPRGIKLFFKTPQLFCIWSFNYLRIELSELKYFFFRK